MCIRDSLHLVLAMTAVERADAFAVDKDNGIVANLANDHQTFDGVFDGCFVMDVAKILVNIFHRQRTFRFLSLIHI